MSKRIFSFFTSLRLTVVCLSMAMVLVFAGTLAQVEYGLWTAQENYFQSLLVLWSPADSDIQIPVWPGGYLLGGLLLVNLIAAHIKRFSFSRKKFGIFLIHAGLILLLLGQFFTELFQVESHMRLEEGQSKNYSESDRKSELAVIDTTEPDRDKVVAISERTLAHNEEISHQQLPFDLRVRKYYRNSRLARAEQADATAAPATKGFGQQLKVTKAPLATKMDERNIPTAVVELVGENGSLGTWLVSNFLEEGQRLTYNGRTYELSMRWTRYYKPYTIKLLEFTHDRYKGTEIPKNFSSRIRLTRPETGEDREILIYMNHPLRYEGETYYQASFEPGDTVTILQVVRNPAWLTPYVSVVIMGVGLLVQFLSHLISFLKRRIT